MQPTFSKTAVVAVFVSSARMERECIRLYAQTHPEVRMAAILPSGSILLEQLRRGLNPQVIVLDALLEEGGVLQLVDAIRAMTLDPQPALLLTAPLPEQTAARRALQAFGGCQVLLKPYRIRELFDQIYLLGAGADEYRLYRARGCCRRYLQQMHADPSMSGCDYLEQMLLYALVAERPMTIASLYQLVAQDNETQEAALLLRWCVCPARCNSKQHRSIKPCAAAAACPRMRCCPTANFSKACWSCFDRKFGKGSQAPHKGGEYAAKRTGIGAGPARGASGAISEFFSSVGKRI